ncbi:MAG: hypothetical protein ACO1O3_01440 [Sphingobium sp.]
MSLYKTLCRWTDTGLGGDQFFQLVLIAPLWAAGAIAIWWWPPGVALGLGWIGFVLWRGTVLARTGYIGADAADIERAAEARPPAEDERGG